MYLTVLQYVEITEHTWISLKAIAKIDRQQRSPRFDANRVDLSTLEQHNWPLYHKICRGDLSLFFNQQNKDVVRSEVNLPIF